MEEYFEQKIYRYNRNIEEEKYILLTNNPNATDNELTIICKLEEVEKLLELAKNLRNHDWTFEMSDDSRYYRWGKEQMNTIRSQISRNGSHGIKLLDFFYPENSSGCHNKKNYLV